MLKPGTAVTIEAYPSKTAKDELRAITVTINGRTFEMR